MIKKLEVSNFRNINYVSLDFETECAILMGANGIGKSNTLNACNWLITNTLLTDKWGSGENDIDTIFPKDYQAGLNPTVTITLDTGTTFTKKFIKGVKGKANTTEYFVNGVKQKTQKDFEEELFKDLHFVKKLKCEKEVKELRLFTDPLYALQKLDAKQLRLLLVELGCSVTNEEVYQIKPDFETLRQYESKYRSDFTIMRTSLKAESQDLKKQVEATDLMIASFTTNDFDEANLVKLEKSKDDLKQKITDLKSGDKSLVNDLEEQLKDIKHQKELYVEQEQSKLNSKLAVLKEKKESALNHAKELQNERLGTINSQIQLKSETLNTLLASKEAYTQTLNTKRAEASKLKAKYDELVKSKQESEEALKEVEKRTFGAYATCPQCQFVFVADAKAEILFNKQKQDDIAALNVKISRIDIEFKQCEKDFADTCQLGRKTAEQLENVETQIKKVEREINELNDSKKNAERETSLVDTERLQNIELEIMALESQEIDTTKFDVDINNLTTKIQNTLLAEEQANANEILGLETELENVEAQIKEQYRLESMLNSKKEAQNNRNKLVSKLNDIDYLIELVNAFIQTKIKMINSKAKDITGIDFVMLEENQTNDGVKEVCYATIDGVEFSNVNTSQKVVAGIQFIEKIKEILGANNLPILADRLEGFDDIEKIKGLTTEQLICTVVGNKNQKEIIVI